MQWVHHVIDVEDVEVPVVTAVSRGVVAKHQLEGSLQQVREDAHVEDQHDRV